MLTFFRQIRKGLLEGDATSKYMLSAIGEIALVVIGILIALQINNWNEDRQKQIQLEETLRLIVSDIDSDLPRVTQNINRIKWRIAIIDSVVNDLIPNERLYNCFYCLTANGFTDDFVHTNTGNEILKSISSGKSSADTLLQEILNFYSTFEEGPLMLINQKIRDDSYSSVENIRDHYPDIDRLNIFFAEAEIDSISPEVGIDLLNTKNFKRRMIFHRTMLRKNSLPYFRFYKNKSVELKAKIEHMLDNQN